MRDGVPRTTLLLHLARSSWKGMAMAVASFSRIHEVLVILFINSISSTTWQWHRQALFAVSHFAW
jgi:hypothetical protein